MLSQYTWPNFQRGSDKEGTKVLINEKGFSHDVKYGETKIFIRSPRTLFALEEVSFRRLMPYLSSTLCRKYPKSCFDCVYEGSS